VSIFSSLLSPQVLIYLVLALVLAPVLGVDLTDLLSGLIPPA
jgi:hypothetical protein